MERVTSPKTRKILADLPKDVVDTILSYYLDEMAAGVEDSVITDETGIPTVVVQAYRIENVGRRRPKRRGEKSITQNLYTSAINLFGDETPPVFVTEVESRVLDHRWEPPTFIRRKPLDYDTMCFAMYQLHRYGMSEERLANAFGFFIEDVDDAITLYKNYLEEHGVICPICRKNKIDPYQQKGCVPRCHVKEVGVDTL